MRLEGDQIAELVGEQPVELLLRRADDQTHLRIEQPRGEGGGDIAALVARDQQDGAAVFGPRAFQNVGSGAVADDDFIEGARIRAFPRRDVDSDDGGAEFLEQVGALAPDIAEAADEDRAVLGRFRTNRRLRHRFVLGQAARCATGRACLRGRVQPVCVALA